MGKQWQILFWGAPESLHMVIAAMKLKIPWRRKWQLTPVLLPRESHGWRSLVGYSPWSRKELDKTERLHFHFTLWKKSYDQPRQHIKKQRHYFANKGLSSQSYVFSSSHVWMWKLGCEESWVPKNWCFWIVVLEKTLERPLDRKEIKPVNPKGNQPWILIGRTDAKAEAPILWPPDAKSWFNGKDPDAGKDWGQEKRGR